MQKKRPDYYSYLLRLWRDEDQERSRVKDQGTAWRASLQSPQSGKRVGFLSLEELFDYLRCETEEARDQDGERGETGKRNQAGVVS